MSEVNLLYQPRKQFFDFHNRSHRFACLVAHRRAGKTVACVNEAIIRALYSKKNRPRYAYIGPLLKQAKKIAWEYLKEYSRGIQAKKPSESELSIRLSTNDAEIGIYGADNPDAFRGQYFDGVILDEYGDMSPSIWRKVLLPTLADRQGWAVFIGTPKGKNHFYDIFQRSLGKAVQTEDGPGQDYLSVQSWYNFCLRASESGILPPDELLLQRGEMTEDEYLQEYECSFDAAVIGTYYAAIILNLEQKGQINDLVDYDPDFPVHVISDLGYTDSSAFWFWQERRDGIAVIDYEEANSQALPYYFELLHSKGYKYGKIWLPHDARAKSLQTGRTTVEQFLDQRFPTFDPDAPRVIDIWPRVALQHGIDAARMILPGCHFNRARCGTGIEALRAYRRQYNEERKVFMDVPIHDWASHGSDAFRGLALVARERILADSRDKPKILIPNKVVQYSLEQLYAMNQKSIRQRMRDG